MEKNAGKGGVIISIIIKIKFTLHIYILINICFIHTDETIVILIVTQTIMKENNTKYIRLRDSFSKINNIDNNLKPGNIATKIQN